MPETLGQVDVQDGERALLTVGGPFRGYRNSVPGDQVSADKIVAPSLQFGLNPYDGKLIRRKGIDYSKGGNNLLEDTYAAGPAGRAYKGVELVEHNGAQLNPALPVTWRALLVDEDQAQAALGQAVWSDAGTPRVLGYNGAWTGAAPNLVPPIAAGVGTIIWPYLMGGRGRSAQERTQQCGGARNSLEVSGRVYYPNFGGTAGASVADTGSPLEWNKARAAAPATVDRYSPAGMLPPMWLPYFTIGTIRAGAPWANGDSFYYSVLPIYEDGEWGPPVQVRPPNDIQTGVAANQVDMTGMANNPGGYGLARLVIGGAGAADYIVWEDLPLLEGRGIGRVLVRSPKVAAGAQPDPEDLRVVAILMNNTQTRYIDGGGLDASLQVDTRVRFDHIVQPPARHIGQFDQRIAVSYVRDIPNALLISFRHNNKTETLGAGGVSLHNNQDSSFDATRESYVTVTATQLILDVAQAQAGNKLVHRRIYALANITLQQLVDKVNSQRQVAADTNVDYRWHAQLVPGADGQAPATSLIATGTWGDNPFAALASAVFDGFASVAGTPAIDGMRDLAPGWCAMLQSSAHARLFKSRLYFTRGGPGEIANSARTWAGFNERRMPPEAGDCAAPVLPLLDGGLVPCTRAICVVRNIRDGKTGADQDYRVEVLDSQRACISSKVAAGPGFNLVLTAQGLYAYDRETLQGINLTEDLYDPGEQAGELAYEIGQCVAATGADTDDDYFFVAVGENKIVLTYRSSAAVTRPDRKVEMDFSPGIEQRGIKTLLDPDTGAPWGWSAPDQPLLSPTDTPNQAVIGFSAVGLVRYSDGVQRWFGTRDRHDTTGGVKEGRIDEFNVGTTDILALGNASNITNAAAYARIMKPSGVRARAFALEVTTKYKKGAAGLTLQHTRNPKAAAPTWRTKALPTSGTDSYARARWPLPMAGRTAAEAHQLGWLDDGSGERPQIWGAILEAQAVDLGV